ncbi:glutamate--cysteine ligase [Amycolatopsis acidiphila]|uniref:Putative glutamate--cysteine ligase 2 n=1 Tax=Amycolatopsis acidiphila TaxID=715473 RepID=A0A558ACR8_9PSEU|nr:glutamate--cysteine ligase [Amycolatopsis acidiphila]TVT22064.1 YbdK family carboxylate-amine ligase [Amycolatopsis acidiphila]UIJ63615.1 glutamate--cysteine ligase [Amycolatopsis acidiphila]GHG67909.1 putative glutamate--cysteine ligase 2 [Amycolatopsis acidiphila]
MTENTALTLGVEEEFLLVDRAGHLVSAGPAVTDEVSDPPGQVEHELRPCQVESATEVQTGVAGVTGGLRALRDELAREAATRDLRLLPAGVPPLAEDHTLEFTPNARYQRMGGEFGAVARSALTCACHVHVSIPDRAAGLAVSNGLRPWLPVLLALTANSPFHEGEDSGHASWRHVMWGRWPSAGPPPHFESEDHYESLVEALLRTGAILDRGMVYWDIRLSEHQPTVEVRVSDVAATVDEAALLAVLVRGLAAKALDDGAAPAGKTGLPPELLRAMLWRGARDGLAGRLVDRDGDLVPAWQLVDHLVEQARPWLRETGDEDFAREVLDRLRRDGGGAQRQRAAFARRHRLADVLDELAWPV